MHDSATSLVRLVIFFCKCQKTNFCVIQNFAEIESSPSFFFTRRPRGLCTLLPSPSGKNRLIRWELFWNLILQFSGYLPTVYNAVPSRDRAVTETALVLQFLFCNFSQKTVEQGSCKIRIACFSIGQNSYPDSLDGE